MSRLAESLRQRILQEGPLTVAQYMASALGDPQYGYYMTRDPFGRAGDFTTAPEISQMFGELIGLWVVAMWQAMGAPGQLHLIELGPGRGTLMADALRALQTVPECEKAVIVHLVETSPILRERQRENLNGHVHPSQIIWHETFGQIPEGPSVIVANEFFDALPIRQFERRADGWCERLVGVDQDGAFCFVLSDSRQSAAEIPQEFQNSPLQSIFEIQPAGKSLMIEMSQKLTNTGGAGLIIDYGHIDSGLGDTLQAVKNQQYRDLFFQPGEIDITAHVDFNVLALAAEEEGARVYGPVTQKEYLEQLGIHMRAESLKAGANQEQVQDIQSALERLTGENEMGDLFKVMAVTHPSLKTPPGFN